MNVTFPHCQSFLSGQHQKFAHSWQICSIGRSFPSVKKNRKKAKSDKESIEINLSWLLVKGLCICSVFTYVQFMSYSKCWNCRRTWNICFLLIISWKMLQPNFAFWDTFMLLRCLNSKEIKLQEWFVLFSIWFFSAEN